MDNLNEKILKIKLLITDVDGVLTNGLLYYDATGINLKHFHVHDGLGLKLLMQHGIQVGIISACRSPATAKRMQDLGIPHIYLATADKLAAYHTLREKLNLLDEEIAYIGDDLPDLPVIAKVGLGIAVANAVPPVLAAADWVTVKRGGDCAVREVCDRILKVQQGERATCKV